MGPVATDTIGAPGGAHFCRHSVVTGEEAGDPVRGQVIPGIETFRGMAAAAHILGHGQQGRGPEIADLVVGVAVGAGGRVPDAVGQCLAVDAALEDFDGFGVAFSAGRGLLVMTQGR